MEQYAIRTFANSDVCLLDNEVGLVECLNDDAFFCC